MNTLLKPLQVRETLLQKKVRTFTTHDFENIFRTTPTKTTYFLETQTAEGLFIRLKRGVYALKTDLPSQEEIAHSLYGPSYISFEYALAYWGVMPEMPYTVTSATTKPTRHITANNMSFAYYSIKEEAYTGYASINTIRRISLKGKDVNLYETALTGSSMGYFLIAEPEKALVDYLYFVSLGKRMENDRLYIEPGTVDEVKAHTYARLYNKKKLTELLEGPHMIANDALAALRTKYHTTELHVQREYMQQLFLSYLYQQPQTKKIYFKGGTALRIVYGSPRFSEDLDFGSALHDVDEIETAVLHTLVEIEREGIKTRIVDSVKTSGGYLAVIAFTFGSTTVQIRLEASFREKELRGETETIYSDFAPPYIINVLAQEQLVGRKIAALLDRKKPRDFYDLYYLLQKGFVSTEHKGLMQEVLPLIGQTKINFTQELKQFLPQSQWAIVKDFKPVLERAVKRFI